MVQISGQNIENIGKTVENKNTKKETFSKEVRMAQVMKSAKVQSWTNNLS